MPEMPSVKTPKIRNGKNPKAASVKTRDIVSTKTLVTLGTVDDQSSAYANGSAYEPHGDTTRAVIERCPNCLYAYADGGYCPECGWTAETIVHSYGTVTGRKWKC
jgi:hypothetical protein